MESPENKPLKEAGSGWGVMVMMADERTGLPWTVAAGADGDEASILLSFYERIFLFSNEWVVQVQTVPGWALLVLSWVLVMVAVGYDFEF